MKEFFANHVVLGARPLICQSQKPAKIFFGVPLFYVIFLSYEENSLLIEKICILFF